MKAYKFRLYPNKEQENKLNFVLDICRQTYNSLLEELQKQTKIDRKEIQHKIVELKQMDLLIQEFQRLSGLSRRPIRMLR